VSSTATSTGPADGQSRPVSIPQRRAGWAIVPATGRRTSDDGPVTAARAAEVAARARLGAVVDKCVVPTGERVERAELFSGKHRI
jgi:hypothetical protein